MAGEDVTRKGCDALDLSALWPCTAQIGCIPVSEMFSQERFSNQDAERDRGDR